MILKEHSVFVIVPIDEEQASSIFKDYANNMDEEELAIKANSFIQKTFVLYTEYHHKVFFVLMIYGKAN